MPNLNLTPTAAAEYAALAMYAWDMCDAQLHSPAPVPDSRIGLSGWTVVGYFFGSDDIVKSGNSIRTMMVGRSDDPSDKVCYGYLARQNIDTGNYVAVIRGTDGAEEWHDDFDFLLRPPEPPLGGQVESGFYSIFDSMTYQQASGGPSTRLANGIATQVGTTAAVTVAGHSLGAVLASYLIGELAVLLGSPAVSGCLFASPKPGDGGFADYFGGLNVNCDIYNYQVDIVPDTPPLGYTALPGVIVLPPGGENGGVQISASPACCHHLFSYMALLDTAVFKKVIALSGMTPDDCKCAACTTL